MTVPTTHSPRPLPSETRRRMQHLLNEGDSTFFARHPDQHYRIRMHFRGETIDDSGEATRYIVVTQEAGRLVRRFAGAGAMA